MAQWKPHSFARINLDLLWGVALLLTAAVLAMRLAPERALPARAQVLYPTADPTP